MAYIEADGNKIYYDPYTNDPKSHFDQVTKKVFNAIRSDVSYEEYIRLANDRSVSAVTKSDLKSHKNAVETDLNRKIVSRGVDTLRSFVSEAEKIDLSVSWNKTKKSLKQEYEMPEKPRKPYLRDVPEEPKRWDPKYKPDYSLLDYILKGRKDRKKHKMNKKFENDHSNWEKKKKNIKRENKKKKRSYQEKLKVWKSKVQKIKEKRRKSAEEVDDLQEKYRSGEKSAVEKVVRDTLKNIPYPSRLSFEELQKVFRGHIKTTFKELSGVLIVDRSIPPPEEIPRREKIKYVKSRDAFKGKDLSKRDFNQLYESIPYQIALRTAYEVFAMDEEEGKVIDTVVFNGWVTSVDPATGHEETVCTLSLQVSREEMTQLNLSRIEPKAAFKNLKGVSASKLREKSPVSPIVQADREDSRFTEGRDVGEDMQEGENIAAMDWEDFEHLIRELFESEFAEEGGEVNVTQASRDGGIDAVAFDPDPLRGGKIVIQAKRYTQTVGVSAVRDLYGTVMNEGASRGILVTTSDYGSGAYDFAKDKPIQLLDGGNLLSMLEQHGYDARIDVEEARENME